MSREVLLAQSVDYVSRHGVADLSLRRLGEAIGSSHRMLIYHFGSRDGLLVAITAVVVQRQHEALAKDLADGGDNLVAAVRRIWARLGASHLVDNERLTFELYGRALRGDPAVALILTGLFDAWIEPMYVRLTGAGAQHWLTRDDVRLCLAVLRGLLLDRLATGDVRATTQALETFLDQYRV